ncbi:MAG: arginase family protein [Bacteroidales bacterium]|nr:arginase family protein [Bacteroidales bacterium]MDD4176712.1 arginase family protein [Bacteroidales bacterium]MDD4740789.1 arginase family protein [Bacteroidales bacterium]
MRSFVQYFKKDYIASLINYREGEEKFGQTLQVSADGDLSSFQGKFVILGIAEDIGIRANHGMAGAASAFRSFIKSLVNIHNSRDLNGDQFLLLGKIRTGDLMEESQNADIETLRQLTEKLDELVFPVIQQIVQAGKIPIVIGGGHNNVFPILKGCSLACNQSINTINLDAHADFRPTEGRHSGNGFRYAYEAGFLKKYALLGLHHAYNNELIIDELNENPDFLPIMFEDIFLRRKETWEQAKRRAIDFVKTNRFGVELDVDSLENLLSSAWSSVGVSSDESLNYLYNCGKEPQVCYLHITEAVYKRSDGMENVLIGKLINYMVQAFCRGVQEQG